jgi:hypothetical protein
MTDIYGHTATATGVKLLPERTQATTVRLTSGSAVGTAVGGTTTAKKKASPSATPTKTKASPSASATSAAPLTESTPTQDSTEEPPVALAAAKRCG